MISLIRSGAGNLDVSALTLSSRLLIVAAVEAKCGVRGTHLLRKVTNDRSAKVSPFSACYIFSLTIFPSFILFLASSSTSSQTIMSSEEYLFVGSEHERVVSPATDGAERGFCFDFAFTGLVSVSSG